MDRIDCQEMMNQYFKYCKVEKRLSPKTLKAYKIDLIQFYEYAIEKEPYSKDCIQEYIALLYEKYSVKTMKRKIASLKAYFNYLDYEDHISNNPFSRMRIKLHEPFVLPRIIPLSTIENMFQCAYRCLNTTDTKTYQYKTILRDVAILELLFATGMRISELCKLKKDDVSLEDRNIKIYGKGAKERYIQIGSTMVLKALQEYERAFEEQIAAMGHYFINRLGNQISDQSVRNMICKYCRLAGIELHITPHMFRHSFATFLLEEDVNRTTSPHTSTDKTEKGFYSAI